MAIHSEALIWSKAPNPPRTVKPHTSNRQAMMAATSRMRKFRRLRRVTGRFQLVKPSIAIEASKVRPSIAPRQGDCSAASMMFLPVSADTPHTVTT